MPKKKAPPDDPKPDPKTTIEITIKIPDHGEKSYLRAARIVASALEAEEQQDLALMFRQHIEQRGRKPQTWPSEFSREHIRAWIEEATGGGLSVDDPLPDTLAATAQALGLMPFQLRIWIWEQPKPEWSGAALERWARARGFALCAHCGTPVTDPQEHQCPPAPGNEAKQ